MVTHQPMGGDECLHSRVEFLPTSSIHRLLEKHMTRIATILAILALPILVAACNTMEGAGQDIQKGGQALENTADRHK